MDRWITRCCLLLTILVIGPVWFSGCVSSPDPGAASAYRPDRYASADSVESHTLAGKDESLASAEAEGDLLMAEGRPYQALRIYLEALGIERVLSPAEEEQQRMILEKSRRIVEKIRIEPLTAGMTVELGRPFVSPFRAQVTFNGKETGLPGVRLLVRHKIPGASASGGESVLRYVSDGSGALSYKPSVPFLPGNGAVYISLDLEGELAQIDERAFSGSAVAEEYRALRRSINSVQAVFPYRVEETGDRVLVAVLVFDRDSAGNPTGGGFTASGLAGVFDTSLFDVRILEADRERPDELPREIARRFAESHGRSGWLIHGNARISEYEEKDGRVYVTVIGSARAVNLASVGPGPATGEMKKSVIGSNSRNTVLSAYRQLGKILGAELINQLR